MKNIQRNPNERGSAILLVLGFLSLLLMMAMIFATTSRNAQIVADAKADETNAQLQARSAVTQAQETAFFLQNKGNIFGSANPDLQDCLPGNANIDQSPSTLANEDKEFFYGENGVIDEDFLGIQPYVGYTTPELPTSWRSLAFYGELSKNAFSKTPFGITPTAPTGQTTPSPYQSIYYSHNTEDGAVDNVFDEFATQGDNSLYAIVKSTTLGKLYFEATGGPGGQFDKLLKEDKKTQLQFRNFFQVSPEDNLEHVYSRQGFIMFSEGSKFDVNRLVSPGMKTDTKEPYVPVVINGALALATPTDDPNDDATIGSNTYAIMGRDYDTGKYASEKIFTTIEEDLSVQYGLHPAELQTRIKNSKTVYEEALDRKDADKPPRWFSYEHLVGDAANADLIAAVKDDIFTLGIESGVDDRELRFNGQYGSMAELLESIGEIEDTDDDGIDDSLKMTAAGKIDNLDSKCSYLAKANIAHPWGLYCTDATCSKFGADPKWDDVSSKLAKFTGSFETYSKHFFKYHLGLNEEKLFLSDSDKDLTPQVFANLVDFCDKNDSVTYNLQNKANNKVHFTNDNYTTSAIYNSADAQLPNNRNLDSDTVVCGNEKNLAVVGVNLTVDMSNSSTDDVIYNEYVETTTSYYYKTRVHANAGKLYFTPTVNLALQNIYNEKMSNVKVKFRVILQGKILPFVLGKEIRFHWNTAVSGERQYYSAIYYPLSNSSNWERVGTEKGRTSRDYNPQVNVLNKMRTAGWNFSCDYTTSTEFSFTNVNEFDHTVINIPMTDAIEIDLPNGRLLGDDIQISNTRTHYYSTGSGYAIKIEKIVVLMHDANDSNDDSLADLVFAKQTTATNENCGIVWKIERDTPKNVISGTYTTNDKMKTSIASIQSIPVTGAVCVDPRMNHDTAGWTWLSATEAGSSDSTNYVIARTAVSTLQSNTFSKLASKKIQASLKNANSHTKDWEPDLAFANVDETAVNACSTYFIANTPIASLWQLGAIHRGEVGRTINLKKFGTDSSGKITHKYTDGDAWILDYLKLNELDANHGIRGKFNPNCFNAGAYRYLFANIPANPDAEDTMIYANGFFDPETEVKRNTYFKDFIGGTAPSTYENLEDNVFRFKNTFGTGKDYEAVSGADGILAAQSWSPVQAFFNFVEVDGGTSSQRTSASSTYKCNDRQAESLIGCTAGLLSTRYEVFTAIAVGQSVKFVMSAADMDAIGAEGSAEREAVMKQLSSPMQICFRRGSNNVFEWYSILSTQVREVTFVRDCWFGKIKVLKSRLL